MDATLHALSGILLKAIPTFLLVVALNFYLKAVFFKPMKKVLAQRYAATEGARKLAEESLQKAAAKTAEYEAALRAARSEIYQAQERIYKEMRERQSSELAAGRQQAEARITAARQVLAEEVGFAKAALAAQGDALAVRIADSILGRRAA